MSAPWRWPCSWPGGDYGHHALLARHTHPCDGCTYHCNPKISRMAAQAFTEPPPHAAHLAQSSTFRVGATNCRLAKLGVANRASVAQNRGCMHVEVGSAHSTHAGPPCFSLNTIASVSFHTMTGHAEMYVSQSKQLGSGLFQDVLQQPEFIDLNLGVTISDRGRAFLFPPGAHIWGGYLAGGSSEIHLDMSLPKYFRPDGSFTVSMGPIPWSYFHAAVVQQPPWWHLLDIWSSADGGATWAQVTGTTTWSLCSAHAAVVRVDGAVLVHATNNSGGTYFHGVWNSTGSGTTWEQFMGAVAWSPRAAHATVVHTDGAVLVLGGYKGSTRFNAVWSPDDSGTTWAQLTGAAA